MIKYVLKRLLLLIPVILGVILIIFHHYVPDAR